MLHKIPPVQVQGHSGQSRHLPEYSVGRHFGIPGRRWDCPEHPCPQMRGMSSSAGVEQKEASGQGPFFSCTAQCWAVLVLSFPIILKYSTPPFSLWWIQARLQYQLKTWLIQNTKNTAAIITGTTSLPTPKPVDRGKLEAVWVTQYNACLGLKPKGPLEGEYQPNHKCCETCKENAHRGLNGWVTSKLLVSSCRKKKQKHRRNLN